MIDNQSIISEISKEFVSLEGTQKTTYLLEKIAELYIVVKNQQQKIDDLERSIQDSELFFSMPEVTLINRSKLPRVVLKAGDVVPISDNFYEAEPFGDGEHIRWTGPERLNNFHVPIDRTQERTLRLSIVSTIKPELLNSIKLYVDGELVVFDIESRNEGTELIATLPPSIRVQDTLISMFIPHLFAPSELDPSSSDNRKLGVAFRQLEVF